MNLRLRIATEQCEPATRAALEELGLSVGEYGQGLLTPAVRELLRGVPTAERWRQDFVVRTPQGRSVLVDSKFSDGRSPNHSIEMRSLLTAGQSDLPTFYVCSMWHPGGVFTDFTAIHYQEIAVVGPSSWPCCDECRLCFATDPDPMRKLPEYCPNRRRGTTGSGTPFFVAKPPFRPLTTDAFDLEPYWFDNGRPILGRQWDRNVVLKPWTGRPRPPSSDQGRIDIDAIRARPTDFPSRRSSGRPWTRTWPPCRTCGYPLDPAGDDGSGTHPGCRPEREVAA